MTTSNWLRAAVVAALASVALGCSSDTFTSAADGDVGGEAGEYGLATGGAAGGVTGALGGQSQAVGGSSATSSAAGGASVGVGGSEQSGGSASGSVTVTAGGTVVTSVPAAGQSSIKSPAMQHVGAYAIDVTEVTRGQYDSWLATAPSVASQTTECSTNRDFVPCTQDADEDPERPVLCVDWCDAAAYCSAVGKRLCSGAEWSDACTSGGRYKYQTGDGTTSALCNVLGSSNGTEIPVASKPTCTSSVPGYTGIYDLTGNVREWTSDCTSAGCAYRGGSFGSESWECAERAVVPRATQYNSVGFRCCKDEK